MFYGRKKELNQLEQFYSDENHGIACIYGRLGIGKTALVKEFLQDKKHIYFNAYATTGRHEVELFSKVCQTSKGKFSDSQSVTEQLNIIFEDIKDKSELDESKLVLVIDNYPCFARAESSFEKELFSFMERALQVKLILLGDSYLTISKYVLDKKAIWKDAVLLSIELKGLGFYETMEYLSDIPDASLKSLLYGITGGIPKNLINVSPDALKSVESLFFEDKSYPLNPERIMQTELRELSYYNHILTVLAKGKSRVNEISACVEKPKDVVVPYMNTLMSIGMVTKENPVTEKTNRKKTRYSIVNTFDLFWYRFFASSMDLYAGNDVEAFVQEAVNPSLAGFMDIVFVNMCKEYLQRKANKGEMPFIINETGNWWQNDDEKKTSQGFDLVAVGEAENDEAMVFGRCYYTDEPVGITTLKELIDLTKQVKGKKNVFYIVFSKNGFHENTTTVASSIKNIILVSLEDIING